MIAGAGAPDQKDRMMTTDRTLGLRAELISTLKLAAPLALGHLAQIGMGLTDTIMLGALGADAIAVGGLGGSLYFTLAMILQGVVSSLGILVAHARGAEDHAGIAPVMRSSVLLATVAVVPLVVILWSIEPVLLSLGQPPALAAGIADYVRVLLLGAPALMWLGTMRTFLAAMNHARMVMVVSVVGLIVNAVLNYGLIHGRFGLPALGVLGSATATAATTWAMMLATAAWIKRTPTLARHLDVGMPDLAILRELLSLGWPIAVTFAVEMLLFMSSGLMMGVLGTTALAAHQVALNVASTTFMIPMACAQAANVRVGFQLGAGRPRGARDAGIAAFILGVGFMAVASLVMLAMPQQLAMLFNLDPANPRDTAVVVLIVDMMLVAACFQVFDGAQSIAVGALRGLKDTRVPMWLAGFGYWGVGFPAAWALGFPLGLGPAGIWWGLALGLAVVAIVLSHRFQRLSARLILFAELRPI